MGKAKVEDIPNPNEGFLYYLMDRHMWIFTLFLVPVSLIYDVYFKLYTLFHLWKDSQKVSGTARPPLLKWRGCLSVRASFLGLHGSRQKSGGRPRPGEGLDCLRLNCPDVHGEARVEVHQHSEVALQGQDAQDQR